MTNKKVDTRNMIGNKHPVAFVCACCGITFYKDITYVRDRIKRERPIKYCSIACSHKPGNRKRLTIGLKG